MQSISRMMKLAGALAIAALATGCVSGPDIRTDYDRASDFSQYKTFNFYEKTGPDKNEYESLFSQYVRAAVTREMEQRGYVKSSDPDLLVNFNAVLEEKTTVAKTPAPVSGYGYYGRGYYGYRGGFYDPWMGYGYAQATHVSQYTQGTFNIDLVDAERKLLVWESVIVGRVTDEVRDNVKAAVDDAVPKMFANYPFRAGSNTPVNTQ